MLNLREMRDLRSTHLAFHGTHEKESHTKNWINRDSSSVEKTSCMLLDNSGVALCVLYTSDNKTSASLQTT